MKARIAVKTGVVQGAAINPDEAPSANAPIRVASFSVLSLIVTGNQFLVVENVCNLYAFTGV